MSIKYRDQAIQTLRTDNTVEVFLVSIQAGSEGWTFTVESEVHLIDPDWSDVIGVAIA